ncbi:hypothetical protein SAMD00019534_085260 [Acytostelium subglobosum LB1]|uniref:hypothetical protein n=1 Tax=Acytostelium subglobosum LB1 TaxID=1410327 RepID=UPI0006448C0F|nr:hypothetical protein SAMD00019534_085260 [Acytostelium subglobosum LB1]GAM25351.1 hypothetical protein SAMD00019534_085260 [Acytostelium subglobosum LB1]|eukprot:XP_012751871.1 hypothetical protein SAMD00019534_085260 [Acytostelium subglobosum LB1]
MTEEEEIFEDGIIFASAKKNHITMLEEFYQQRLKNKTFNANITDALGNTPLHYSATFKHLECCKRLLDLGASANIQNRAGETPLHKAVWYNNTNIAELLIEKGGDVSICNNSKQNALGLAKSAEMRSLIQQAQLALKFNPEDFADDDDDDEQDPGTAKKSVTSHSQFHADMVADDSDDD